MTLSEQLALYALCLWDPEDLVELRYIDRTGRKSPGRHWHYRDAITGDGWPRTLASINATQDVYAGINPRKCRGGKAADVALARCLFVDFDDMTLGAAADRLDAARLPVPTCVVWSGGGPHCYWRLAEPLTDLGVWSGLQRRLIAHLHSDPTIHDAPRIMRLPGLRNHKPGRTAAELVYADPHRRHWVDRIATKVPEESRADPVSVRRTWLPTNREKIVKRAAAYVERIEPAVSGQRGHSRTFRVACVLAQRFGLTREEAMPILEEFNQRCTPPWREKDLARKYDQAANHKTRRPLLA